MQGCELLDPVQPELVHTHTHTRTLTIQRNIEKKYFKLIIFVF